MRNEKADFLAKRRCNTIQKLTLSFIKLEINRVFRHSFQAAAAYTSYFKPWSILNVSSSYISDDPCAAITVIFTLFTGQNHIRVHLFHFDNVHFSMCLLYSYKQNMTAAHIENCPALSYFNCIVGKYWKHIAL